MAKGKDKTKYGCTECGNEYARWQGQCDYCKVWNTIVEIKEAKLTNGKKVGNFPVEGKRKAVNLNDVNTLDYPGFSSGIKELDRVLGGKVVNGSLVLLSGEPGKGKSTLLLDLAANVSNTVGPVLYASGEENEKQIRNRAERLSVRTQNLHLLHTDDIDEVEESIIEIQPVLLILDSIQTTRDTNIAAEAGSVKQVKECTARLMHIAKKQGITTFVIGHVTKDDSIAGPRNLEHMVDTVLFLEGDKTSELRLVKSIKNRFGDASELGCFLMEPEGMVEVPNPSEFLISNRSSDSSGSAIVCITDTRPLLIEIQSLVTATSYENAIPRRTSVGFPKDRMNMIIAVLEKKCGAILGNKDIFINVAGGMKLSEETASDLGLALSIASSERDVIVDANVVVVGEIGLSGEVRKVGRIEQLVKEAEKNGFNKMILPEKNFEYAKKYAKKIELVPVSKVSEAINHLLGPRQQKQKK